MKGREGVEGGVGVVGDLLSPNCLLLDSGGVESGIDDGIILKESLRNHTSALWSIYKKLFFLTFNMYF